MDKRMKMIGKIFIVCGIVGFVLLFGFLLNRVDSLQQSVNLLNNAVVGVSWTVNDTISHRLDNQQTMIDQQRSEISRINSSNNKKCPWQSALHNPNLVNKYSISVDTIEKNASTELTGTYGGYDIGGYYIDVQGGKWTHAYNETMLSFPKEAIVYLKTLKPLKKDSTYLINISILNNSTDSNVSEYQQSVFEYPQDAINYLEFINECGQAEQDQRDNR